MTTPPPFVSTLLDGLADFRGLPSPAPPTGDQVATVALDGGVMLAVQADPPMVCVRPLDKHGRPLFTIMLVPDRHHGVVVLLPPDRNERLPEVTREQFRVLMRLLLALVPDRTRVAIAVGTITVHGRMLALRGM